MEGLDWMNWACCSGEEGAALGLMGLRTSALAGLFVPLSCWTPLIFLPRFLLSFHHFSHPELPTLTQLLSCPRVESLLSLLVLSLRHHLPLIPQELDGSASPADCLE